MTTPEADKRKTTRLNVHLIKPEIDAIKNMIVEEYHGDIKKIQIADCDEAHFIYKKPEPSMPDWYQYLGKIGEPLPKTLTNPSAVILLKVGKCFFAITFGYGRFIVDDRAIVSDFGLKVCLNTIPSNKIKTVDKRTLEQMALHTRQQAVIPVDFNTFELEIDRDLVKSIEGHIEGGLGSYLKGAVNLTIATKRPIDELADLCRELHKIYKKKDYLAEFSWIDNVKPVKDTTLSEKLNLELIQLLNQKKFNGIFLGAPEIVDDINVSAYRFKGVYDKSQYIIFPSIEQYVAVRTSAGSGPPLDLQHLFSDKVAALNRNTPPSEYLRWTVFKCVHAEVLFNSTIYKLLEGNWYEIDQNFISRIDKQIKSIPIFSKVLPDMSSTESENVYNKRVAAGLKGVCLDCELVGLQGRSKFEFCDIFTKDKEIIHVKKHYGASAISHLLYQSLVSAQAFVQHQQARVELANFDTIKKANLISHINPKNFRTSDYEVVLSIASTKSKKVTDTLSFFSKISLAHKYNTLSNLGYKVSLATIKII